MNEHALEREPMHRAKEFAHFQPAREPVSLCDLFPRQITLQVWSLDRTACYANWENEFHYPSANLALL
jgi:hypothetical protein